MESVIINSCSAAKLRSTPQNFIFICSGDPKVYKDTKLLYETLSDSLKRDDFSNFKTTLREIKGKTKCGDIKYLGEDILHKMGFIFVVLAIIPIKFI